MRVKITIGEFRSKPKDYENYEEVIVEERSLRDCLSRAMTEVGAQFKPHTLSLSFVVEKV